MAITYLPETILNGLVFYLDAGNPKAFIPQPNKANPNMATWTKQNSTVTATGSVTPPEEGETVYLIEVTDSSFNITRDGSVVSGPLTPDSSITHTFSIYVRGMADTQAATSIYIEIGANASASDSTTISSATTDWIQLEAIGIGATGGADTIRDFTDIRVGGTAGNKALFSTPRTIKQAIDDVSGQGVSIELKNGAVREDENLGNLAFDGTDDYALTQVGPEVNYLFADASNAFTVLTWFKPSGVSGVICGAAGGIGGATTFAQYMDGTTAKVRIRGSSTGETVKTGLSTTDFHMIAYTWDGTTGYGYYNDETPATITTGTFATNQSYLFGLADCAEGALGNYNRFSGQIALSMIYDRALSSAEILQNYNVIKNRFGL